MYKKSYFNTCDRCGSNLDPGERCECEKREEVRTVIWIPPMDKRKRPVAAV